MITLVIVIFVQDDVLRNVSIRRQARTLITQRRSPQMDAGTSAAARECIRIQRASHGCTRTCRGKRLKKVGLEMNDM